MGVQYAIGLAAIISGKQFGVGGDRWDIKETRGSGYGSEPTETTIATLTGYVIISKPMGASVSPLGTFIADTTRWFVTDESKLDSIGNRKAPMPQQQVVSHKDDSSYIIKDVLDYEGVFICPLNDD